MRLSVIHPFAAGDSCWAFGHDLRTGVQDGHTIHPTTPALALYAAAGFPQGALIAPHRTAVLAVLGPHNSAAAWEEYRTSGGDWTAEQKVAAWTLWRHKDHHGTSVWVWLAHGDKTAPSWMREPLGETPERELCYRMLEFASLFGHPYVLTPGHTAHLALYKAIQPDPANKGVRPDRRTTPYWGIGQRWEYPAGAGGDMVWSRRPTREETHLGWLQGYDLNAARLAALNTVTVATKQLESTGPIGFDPELHGYWFIDRTAIQRRHVYPDRIMEWGVFEKLMPPLISRPAVGPVVVTTPIMTRWMERGILPPVSDAKVAPGRRLFRNISERWNKARTTCHPMYLDTAKALYRAGCGLMASPGGLIYRPDWYHTTQDRERVTMWDHTARIFKAVSQTPIKVTTDCLWYASDWRAWEAFAEEAGITIDHLQLGAFKPHKTIPMADALKPLAGKR